MADQITQAPAQGKPEDGGPAFPLPGWHDIPWPTGTPAEFGMGATLRDYFAAKAMQGALCGAAHHYEGGRYVNLANIDPAGVASYAYSLADAMLAARKGGA